jgi:putative pyruvate formate lyase activating enzyme
MIEFEEKIKSLNYQELLKPLEDLRACRICPRNCNADRFSKKLGYCKADASFSISSIFAHQGEEPVISGDKGICNIFFTNCNLQCIYCQNHQISCNSLDYSARKLELKDVLRQVLQIMSTGINHVGFVSPSHFIPQVKAIINALRSLGLDPVFVYNTNGYDTTESIRGLEGFIDIYLPDFKYADKEIGRKYSDVKDYPETALSALKEMYRQVGADLPLDKNGYARKGMIIRHLVLPGHPENSINVLKTIARELSCEIHISLMSQYYPTYQVNKHEFLGRTLNPEEYERVTDELEELGFENGWVQEMSSAENYRPDFEKEEPFSL